MRPLCTMMCAGLIVWATCTGKALGQSQWAADPLVNQVVSSESGVQGRPRVASTSDGWAYVCWFSSVNAPNYWQVRMNRLDPCGRRAWASDLIVADAPQGTSFAATTIDYDLRVDNKGNALLVFTDFRSGSLNRNVFAYRISPTGQMLWGPTGVALTSDNLTKSNPRVVQTDDGQFSVMWVRLRQISPPVPAGLMFQRLNGAGVELLAAGGLRVIGDETVNQTPNLFEMYASDAGSVVVAYVRDTRTISSPRHVHAQKISPTGVRHWNAGNPVVLSDQPVPATPITPRPAVISDGDGGLLAAWHDTRSGTPNVWVGRVTREGVITTPANGAPVSIGNARSRLDPALAPGPSPGSVLAFWRENDAGAGTWGVYAQRLDLSGISQWAPEGLPVVPLSAVNRLSVRAQTTLKATACFWISEPGNASQQTIEGAAINAAGALTWSGGLRSVASTPSTKNFVKHPLDTTADTNIAREPLALCSIDPDAIVVAWQDNRADADDLLAQRVNADSTLGARACLSDINASGDVSVQDIFDFLEYWFAGDARSDVNCTGGSSVQDIFDFLGRWFSGC